MTESSPRLRFLLFISEEGLFIVGHCLPQIIKFMSLMEMENAARHETDMVIHNRTPCVARTWTDGSFGKPDWKGSVSSEESGGKTETGPQLLCWRLWRGGDSERSETMLAWRFTIHRLRLWG